MTIHPNDKQNLKKHRVMEQRLQEGRANPNCKWMKRRNRRLRA